MNGNRWKTLCDSRVSCSELDGISIYQAVQRSVTHQTFTRLKCSILKLAMASEKTFYLETFGCQMNAHDSEKVIGTLLHEGYRQVDTEEDAGLILYNTCSIRDKAEQKVFNRLNDYKKLHKAGQALRRARVCRAAGRREDI